MTEPRWGEIWRTYFPDTTGREQKGLRPVLVVSSDLLNEVPESLVIVAPITSTDRSIDWHVRIPANDETGLKNPSIILTDQIRATDRVRFKKKYGRASPDVMARVKEELLDLLDLVDI